MFRKRRKSQLNYQVNPIKAEKGRAWSVFFKVLNVVLLVAIIYFVYFFLFSGYYQIKNVQVEGINFVSADDFIKLVNRQVEEDKFLKLPNKNLFLFSKAELRKRINQHYLFEEVVITKILPDTVKVEIIEKNVVFRLKSPNSEYLADDGGLIVKKVMDLGSRPPLLMITEEEEKAEQLLELKSINQDDPFSLLYFESETSFNIADQVMSPSDVDFIQELLIAKSPSYELKLITLPAKNPQHLTMVTVAGWEVIFNLNQTFNKQQEALNIVLTEEVGERMGRLEYVDLRLGSNIYYKLR